MDLMPFLRCSMITVAEFLMNKLLTIVEKVSAYKVPRVD
jgi:hypothetical protein